jgi:hypothetical protein
MSSSSWDVKSEMEKKPIVGRWIVRVGDRKGRKLQITHSDNVCYVAHDRHHSFTVPQADYEFCDPPVEDVTNKLYVKDGKVYCDVPGLAKDDHIATLCCNGNYTVSFNPFKVERIS